MDKVAVGEVFHHNQSKLRIFFLTLCILILCVSNLYAAKESEVFRKGYEYYLSYQPDKAIEEFKIFLRDYPLSSSRDAILFWLGKAYLQIQSPEEARKVFSDLKRQFPESPYLAYVSKELERLPVSESSVSKAPSETAIPAHNSETVKGEMPAEEKTLQEKQMPPEIKAPPENQMPDQGTVPQQTIISEESKNGVEDKAPEVDMNISDSKAAEDNTVQAESQTAGGEQLLSGTPILAEKKEPAENEVPLDKDTPKEIQAPADTPAAPSESKTPEETKPSEAPGTAGEITLPEKIQLPEEKKVPEETGVLPGLSVNEGVAPESNLASDELSHGRNAFLLSDLKKGTKKQKGKLPLYPYSLQVGLFKNKANAISLTESLKKKGYNAFLKKEIQKERAITYYRVLVGTFENKSITERYAKIFSRKENIKVVVFRE